MSTSWRFILRASGVLVVGVALPIVLFAVVQNVLLAALPCPNPDRLAILFTRSERKSGERLPVSGLNLRDLAAQMHTIDGFGAILPISELPVRFQGLAGNVPAAYISDGLLPLLNVSPIRGHWFPEGTARPSRQVGAAIVSEHFWRKWMNASPNAIGSAVAIPELVIVVGVVPDLPILSLLFGIEPDLYFPLGTHPGWYGRHTSGFQSLLHLRADSSIEALRSELRVKAAQLRTAYPKENQDFTPAVAGIRDVIIGRSESILWLLFLATGVVWILSATNVSGLLALRLQERRAEIAVRCALGASVSHIIVVLSRELAWVAAVGSLLGAVAGWVGVQFIRTHAEWFNIPRIEGIRIDVSVLAFGISVAAVACVFALILNIAEVIRLFTRGLADSGSGQRYSRTARLGKALVAFQLCLAMLLANVAAVTGHSLMQVETRPLGYKPRHVLAVRIRFDPEVGRKTVDAVTDFVVGLPGVEDATYGYPRPTAKEFMTEFSLLQGDQASSAPAVRRDVAESYFRILAIPLLRGRLFNSYQDVASGAVIVNAAFAETYSDRQEVVGRTVYWVYTGREKVFRVIGVVGDCIEGPLESARPTVYFPSLRGVADLLIRTDSPQQVMRPLSEFVRRIAPNVTVSDIETLDNAIQTPLGQAKMQTFLSVLFALASILVASAGLYTIVQHAGQARRQEYAIHTAVGATSSQMIRRRLAETMWTSIVGLGAGIVLSIISGRLIAAMLFRVPASDPMMLGLATVILLFVAVCATYRPIMESASINPSELLRAN